VAEQYHRLKCSMGKGLNRKTSSFTVRNGNESSITWLEVKHTQSITLERCNAQFLCILSKRERRFVHGKTILGFTRWGTKLSALLCDFLSS